MDPASAAGLLASCIAIAGLATKITHSIENHIQNFANAPQTLSFLQSQVGMFSAILSTVERGIKPYVDNPASVEDEFASQCRSFVESSQILLKRVYEELQFVLQGSKNHNSSKLSFFRRLLMMWNEDRIRLQCDDIQRHVTLYSGLVLSQAVLAPSHNAPDLTLNRQQLQEGTVLPSIRTACSSSCAEFRDEPQQQNGISTQIQAESVAKAPWAFQKFYSEETRRAMEEDTSEAASKLTSSRFRFRVVIIGKAGDGKTRLCRRILGIRPPKGKLYGSATPASNVWTEQTWRGENDNLALHDAGGFDVGGEHQEDDPVQIVKDFIQSRRFTEDGTPAPLTRQIHCIWYCISCVDRRPIQPIDRRFFKGEFDTGDIPIIIIFTQYDALVEEWRKRLEARRVTKEVERAAFEYYEQELKKEVLRLVPHDANVKFIRTGICDDGVEYALTRGSDPEPHSYGSKQLVKQMNHQLSDELKLLWVATQQADGGAKLFVGVKSLVWLYWTAIAINSVPILPLVSLSGLATAYSGSFNRAQKVWQIQTEIAFVAHSPTLAGKMIKAVFGINDRKITYSTLAHACDIFGPLTSSKFSKVVLKLIVGINLLFQKLWERQRSQWPPRRLSDEEVSSVCESFKKCKERVIMDEVIEKNINVVNCFERRKAKEVAVMAVEGALGEPTRVAKGEKAKRKEWLAYEFLE